LIFRKCKKKPKTKAVLGLNNGGVKFGFNDFNYLTAFPGYNSQISAEGPHGPLFLTSKPEH
jgi:hypothetical protein